MKSPAIILLAAVFAAGALSAAELPRFKDPGKPITVEAGTIFVIELESNRTTGYEWQISRPVDTSALELIGVEYIKGPASLVGAGGKENWTFKALSPRRGAMPLSFKYVRPWEKNAKSAKEIFFSVNITNGPEGRQLEEMQREMDRMRDEGWTRRIEE